MGLVGNMIKNKSYIEYLPTMRLEICQTCTMYKSKWNENMKSHWITLRSSRKGTMRAASIRSLSAFYLHILSFPLDTQVALLRHGDGLQRSCCLLHAGTTLPSAQTHSEACKQRQNKPGHLAAWGSRVRLQKRYIWSLTVGTLSIKEHFAGGGLWLDRHTLCVTDLFNYI